MPKGEGKQAVIERILEAALEVFAEKGFAAAPIEEIAARARVNKAMLYYYVGNKEELFTASILRVMAPAREAVAKALEMTASPEEKLKLLQSTFARLFSRSPHLPRLVLRMLATELEHIPKPVLAAMAGMYAITASVVSEGVRRGSLRPINPAVAHLLLVGSLALACEAAKLLRRVVAEGLLSPPAALPPVEELAAGLSDILLHGLANQRSTP